MVPQPHLRRYVTRMFCFNERGSVVTENTGGVLTVNGHAYRDPAKRHGELEFRAAVDDQDSRALSASR
jgi:uncharacterized FAD-dependent dehydrogenase